MVCLFTLWALIGSSRAAPVAFLLVLVRALSSLVGTVEAFQPCLGHDLRRMPAANCCVTEREEKTRRLSLFRCLRCALLLFSLCVILSLPPSLSLSLSQSLSPPFSLSVSLSLSLSVCLSVCLSLAKQSRPRANHPHSVSDDS